MADIFAPLTDQIFFTSLILSEKMQNLLSLILMLVYLTTTKKASLE